MAMGSQGPKSLRSLKSSNSTTPPASRSSSLSSHLAMVELKQRILTSLSKLADRDTHHIALEELESTISTLQNDAVPMLLNCLFDASSSDPKPAVKKEALRVIGTLAASHPDTTSTHLVKIIAHIAKRLRDPDTGVRDACRDTIGTLSGIYVRATTALECGVVSLFVRPLFEAMGENNKGVQIGASMCLGRVVECAENPPIPSLQKLSPRICKFLNSPSFFAKSSLLPVIATLSQVGAIAQQNLEPLLQSIHECLTSTDWATRKAAAETLGALGMHSRDLLKDSTESTITVLEASKFDKIKPVRDSMSETLQLWKKVAGIGGEGSVGRKTPDGDTENCVSQLASGKYNRLTTNLSVNKSLERTPSNANGSVTDLSAKPRIGTLLEKAAGLLKKKVPGLTDREVNPEFFQKLEKSGTGDLTVEVVLPRKCVNSTSPHNADPEQNGADSKSSNSDQINNVLHSRLRDLEGSMATKGVDDPVNGKELQGRGFEHDEKSLGSTKDDGLSDGSFMNNKGNWLAIQRQLMQLERQQTNLMNMLQDFMGGSHDSMITLENRVRSLERVVEDMVHDLSLSSGRRGNNNFMSGYEGSSSRSMSRYNGFFDYSSKFGRGGGDGRLPLDGMRGRGPSWKSNLPDSWDFQPYGPSRSRRDVDSSHMDGRSPKSEPDNEQASGRRAWDKGAGPVRLGEGPSARSVWQASKDEATLEAIRVAGDDNGGTVRRARVAIPEMTAEAMGDDENGQQQERDPVWTAWGNAMDALHVGDIDSAYAEVLGIGDDFLLVKLMDRTGPILDQLSNEVAIDVLSALVQLLMDQNLFDLCFSWVQQLVDIIIENGPEVFGIPMDVRRELLVNFHHASSTTELPEDWEGGAPEQLVLQLATAWEINMQHGN